MTTLAGRILVSLIWQLTEQRQRGAVDHADHRHAQIGSHQCLGQHQKAKKEGDLESDRGKAPES